MKDRGTWIVAGTLLVTVLYLLSSGPARAIWPERNWRGGSLQLRAEFGVSRPAVPWAEPVASVYAPLIWLGRHSILGPSLAAYWTVFDRENFYCDEVSGHWPAIEHSRIGTAVRTTLNRSD